MHGTLLVSPIKGTIVFDNLSVENEGAAGNRLQYLLSLIANKGNH